MLVLIGPQAQGHAVTTSKVRYTSSTAGKCRPKWGRAAGQREEERQSEKGLWQQIHFRRNTRNFFGL